MTKKFAAAIILVNVVAAVLLYLSTQAMLLHLSTTDPYLTLTGVDFYKISVGAVQPAASSTPLIMTAFPNLPFFFLLVPLLLNAFLTTKVWRMPRSDRQFPVVIIVANVVMALLLYLANQATLTPLVGATNSYVRIYGVSFLSFYQTAVQVGSSPIPLVVISKPNLPSYLLTFSLIVNAFFVILQIKNSWITKPMVPHQAEASTN
jgi:hypothetical protein